MNNLKFLSLIGYAPTILKPEVNNNYVVRSLNPVTHFPSPAGNRVTLCTFLPNQPFPANLSQVRKPLSSFYNTFLPSLPKLIPFTSYRLTPQGGLAKGDGKKGFSGVTLFTLCLSQRNEQKGLPQRGLGSKGQSPKKRIPKPNRVLTPPLLTCYPRMGISKAPSKGSNPFFSPLPPTGVCPKGKGGSLHFVWVKKVSRTEGIKLLSPRGGLYKLELGALPLVKGFRAGQRGLVKREISMLVKVSKFRLTGPLNALNAFTRSLRKRISYLTLTVQFNCLIFFIKKIVNKHIANQSVYVLIKKLNLLILTFFKYIGSLSVDFCKVAKICSILPYTGSTTIAVGRSCCRIAYGISVGKGRWIGIERETRLKRVLRRLPTFFVRCPCTKSLYTYTFMRTPSLLALLTPLLTDLRSVIPLPPFTSNPRGITSTGGLGDNYLPLTPSYNPPYPLPPLGKKGYARSNPLRGVQRSCKAKGDKNFIPPGDLVKGVGGMLTPLPLWGTGLVVIPLPPFTSNPRGITSTGGSSIPFALWVKSERTLFGLGECITPKLGAKPQVKGLEVAKQRGQHAPYANPPKGDKHFVRVKRGEGSGAQPQVKRVLEGRDKFAYKGYKQRVIQAKRAYISLFFCSIKSFKKTILEFSRYLKLYLYKILWKWVQKRDTKLSQITLIYKYWIFIQNNAKFYTLKQ